MNQPQSKSERNPLISSREKDIEVLLRAAYKAENKTASARTLTPSQIKRACSRVKDKRGFPGELVFANEVCGQETGSGMPIFKLSVTVVGLESKEQIKS